MSRYVNIKTGKYVDKEIKYLRKYLLALLKKTASALKLARKELKIRLEGMNEIRSQLKDQAETFATKSDLESIEQKIESIQKIINMWVGGLIVLQFILAILVTVIFKIKL